MVVVILVMGFGVVTVVLVVGPDVVVVRVVDIGDGTGSGSKVVEAACMEVPLIMERTRTRTIVRA